MKKPTRLSATTNRPIRMIMSFVLIGLFLTELRAQLTEKAKSDNEQILKLSPFTVTEKQKTGWNSQQTFSGSRVAQNIMNIPVSISIINENYIKALGANSLFDVINYSAASVNSRVTYRDDFTIRGFRESPTLDGVPFTSLDKTPLWDIDRIEVVKGPTALVYGNAAVLGGTINYVTKRPNQTTLRSGDLSVLTGINGRYGFNITERAPLTQDGKIRYRLTAGLSEYDGFRDYEFENYRLLSGSVDWTVNEDIVIQVDVGGHRSHRADANRSLVDPKTQRLAVFPDGFTTTADWGYQDFEFFRGKVEAIYAPNRNFTARILYSSSEGTYDYEIAQPFPGLKVAEAPNYVTVGQRFLDYHQKEEKRDLQGDISWEFNLGPSKNQLTAGAAELVNDHRALDFWTATLGDIIIKDSVSSRPQKPSRSSNSSTFTLLARGNKTYNTGWTGYINDAVTLFDDRLILSAGTRFITAGATNDGKSRNVSRYGIVYKPNQNFSAFGAYGKSFQPLSGFDILGKPYVDISGENKEVGVKINLFGGRLYGTISYFDTFKDPVVTQKEMVTSTGVIVYGNVQTAKETNKGFEAEVGTSLEIGDGQLMGFLVFYDADPRDAKGLRPARAASTRDSIFTRYELKKGSLQGFTIGAGVSNYGDSVGTGIPIQPGYTLYNGVLGYNAKNWSLMLNMDNLSNVKDAIMGSEASFAVTLAPPLDTRLTYSYRW